MVVVERGGRKKKEGTRNGYRGRTRLEDVYLSALHKIRLDLYKITSNKLYVLYVPRSF
jgi:hypothetical protein